MNFMWVAYPRFGHIWVGFAFSIVKQQSTKWIEFVTILIDWYRLKCGSSRLCVIIFAYGIVKCLSGKTFRAILRIFYQYRPRFHT